MKNFNQLERFFAVFGFISLLAISIKGLWVWFVALVNWLGKD